MEKTIFETLSKVDVSQHIEKKKTGKTELSYLSWSWAWAEVKKLYPQAKYEIKMFDGLPYIFDAKTGYMVFTEVTINDETHSMWLPVMDGANKAMKDVPYEYQVKSYGKSVNKTCQAATMFDINKTIMRCLVKNLAMFGLGLYIYSGEDLPEAEQETEREPESSKPASKAQMDELHASVEGFARLKDKQPSEVVQAVLNTKAAKDNGVTDLLKLDAVTCEILTTIVTSWINKCQNELADEDIDF
jgi:hypothetical protein